VTRRLNSEVQQASKVHDKSRFRRVAIRYGEEGVFCLTAL
jgi:hypothetical protein